MVGQIESALLKSKLDLALRDVHPDIDWDIFRIVVIGVDEEEQGSCDPLHNQGIKKGYIWQVSVCSHQLKTGGMVALSAHDILLC